MTEQQEPHVVRDMTYHSMRLRVGRSGAKPECVCGWRYHSFLPTHAMAYGAFKEHALGKGNWRP